MNINTRNGLLFTLLAALFVFAACNPAAPASPTTASSPAPEKTYLEEQGQINVTVRGKEVKFLWFDASGCDYTMEFGKPFTGLFIVIQGSAGACTVEDIEKSFQVQKAAIDAIPGKMSMAIYQLKSEMSKANSISEANQAFNVEFEESVEGGGGKLSITGNASYCSLNVSLSGNLKNSTGYQIWGDFPCTKTNVVNMLNSRFATGAPFGQPRIKSDDLPEWEPALVSKFLASFDNQTFWAKTNSSTSVDVTVEDLKVTLSLSLRPTNPEGYGCNTGLGFKFMDNTGSVNEFSKGPCTVSAVDAALSGFESQLKSIPGTYSLAIDVIVEEMIHPTPPPTVTPNPTFTPLLHAAFFDPLIGAREIQNGEDVYMLTWQTVVFPNSDVRCHIGRYGGPKTNVFLAPEVTEGGCTKEKVIGTAENWKDTAPDEQKPHIGKIIEEIQALPDQSTLFDPEIGSLEKEADGKIFFIIWQTFEFPQADVKFKCMVSHYGGQKEQNIQMEYDDFDGRCTKDLVIGIAEKWKETAPAEHISIIEELIEEIRRLE